MALTVAECDFIIDAAREGGTVLAVGLMRRFAHSAQWVKGAIDAGVLGRIESFNVQEGSVYGWPSSSDFILKKQAAGGGVLADTGAHTLDLLLWWLGDFESVTYWDDSYGGVEADCKLALALESGATGIVELSRTRNLRQSAILRGEHGSVQISLDIRNPVQLSADPHKLLDHRHESISGSHLRKQNIHALFTAQMRNWLRSIARKHDPLVSGGEAKRSVRLMEMCYDNRQLLELPWMNISRAPLVSRQQHDEQ
jgi:predicted dehydrogenase